MSYLGWFDVREQSQMHHNTLSGSFPSNGADFLKLTNQYISNHTMKRNAKRHTSLY